LGHANGVRQGSAELLESAFVLPRAGELEQLVLGILDQVGGRLLDLDPVGVVDYLFAEIDQGATQIEIVDAAGVRLGVDDVQRTRRELRQVAGSTDFGEAFVLLQELLPRYRAGLLPS